MINILQKHIVKKYLRSLISCFEYNHDLIIKIDCFVNNPTKDNIIYKLYECIQKIISIKIVTNSDINYFLTRLFSFGRKIYLNNSSLESFLSLYNNSTDFYKIGMEIYQTNLFMCYNTIIFSILYNIKNANKIDDLIIIKNDDLDYNSFNTSKAFDEEIKRISNINKEYRVIKKEYSLKDISKLLLANHSNLYSYFNVKEIRVFGSYYYKNNTKYSDIDFMLIYNSSEAGTKLVTYTFKNYLRKLFKTNVDVVSINIKETIEQFEIVNLINSVIVYKVGEL